MTTLNDYKHNTDLAALVAADLRQQPKRSGKWLTFSCPFDGHSNKDKNRSLCVVNTAGNRPGYWKCYGCGRHGSAVDWLMEYHDKTLDDVVEMLRQSAPLPVAPPRPEPLITAPEVNGFWQERAYQFMNDCKEFLWNSKHGQVALDYLLNERKFSEAMLRTWDIGFNPTTWFDFKRNWGLPVLEGESRKMILRRGIVIPCYETGIIHYLKIRVLPNEQKADEAKYRKVAGSQPGIMGLDTVLHTETVFATEGELNLLPLWDAINRLEGWASLGSISFGSASDYAALPAAAERFLPVRQIIAVFDNDKAGHAARQRLAEVSGRFYFPFINTDLADYHQQGNDVAAWIQYQIENAKNAPRDPAFEK